MTKTNRLKALAVAVSAALALFLLALLTAQPAEAAFPGQNGKIAFDRAFRIWEMSPTPNAPETKLRDDGPSDSRAAYSPDGSRVAFVRNSPGPEIFVTNADGTGTPKRLTTNTVVDTNPVWSHDGTRIAFERAGQVWTMNADGTNPLRRTIDGVNTDPSWSVPLPGAPDGKIVYRHNNAELWTMEPDGTVKAKLNFDCPTENGLCDTSIGIPTFSPDGTKIAFDYSGDIYWTTTAGDGNSTPILRGGVNSDQEYPGDEKKAAWSPDGTKIAFMHNGDIPGSQYAVYTANADGTSTGATQISSVGVDNLDWQPIVPKLAVNNVKVNEKAATARFVVSLSVASQQAVTVDYATANGTAKAPADYTTTAGTLTFLPGKETTKTVAVPIKNDRRDEPNETFFVDLSNASTTIADGRGKGTIVDND